jgi:hypothetical protein
LPAWKPIASTKRKVAEIVVAEIVVVGIVVTVTARAKVVREILGVDRWAHRRA